MKVWFVLREGPGSGPSYSLDPGVKPMLSLGRSSQCDIIVDDRRASRHHADVRWNGRRWEIIDRDSTNGTFVNGRQIHQARELEIGDRVSLGETTMILRAPSPEAAAPPWSQSSGTPVRAGPHPAPAEGPPQIPPQPARATPYRAKGPASTAATVAFWSVQPLVAAAVVCMAAGAFLPWLRVTGSLSQDLHPLLQGIANIVSILSGPNSILNMTQEISGLEGYGKLTLAIAVVSLLAFVLDVIFYRRSAVPGIVYLISGAIGIAAIAFDLVNYYRLYDRMKDMSLLFGVRLEQVIQVFDQFLDVQITPMIGLMLTGAGLILLFAGGVGRLIVALLARTR